MWPQASQNVLTLDLTFDFLRKKCEKEAVRVEGVRVPRHHQHFEILKEFGFRNRDVLAELGLHTVVCLKKKVRKDSGCLEVLLLTEDGICVL